MSECYYSNCDLYKNNEHCMDSIEFCEYSLREHDAKVRADALGEYATMLMSVFSHSCDFYRTVDGINIEAIEKQNIDDVILKCLEKVKEQKNE